MKVSHCLIGCNDNPLYLDFWPLVKRMWLHTGIIPVLYYIADTPLKTDDPNIIFVKAVEGIPTPFQAQMIRMLAAATVDSEDMVITSDMDMIPTCISYWQDCVRSVGPDKFVVYRNVLEHEKQFPICYLGATPKVWNEIFPAGSLNDALSVLASLYTKINGGVDGMHGGRGWFSDQLIVYNLTQMNNKFTDRIVKLNDFDTGFIRLDRADNDITKLDSNRRFLLCRGAYSDYHMLRPMSQWKEYNTTLVNDMIKKQSMFDMNVFVSHISSETFEMSMKTIEWCIKNNNKLQIVSYGVPKPKSLSNLVRWIPIEDTVVKIAKTILYSMTCRGVFIPPGYTNSMILPSAMLENVYEVGVIPKGSVGDSPVSEDLLNVMSGIRRKNIIGSVIFFNERCSSFMYQWLVASSSFAQNWDEMEVFNSVRWKYNDDPGFILI